ncbi:MAG: diguanylate cyclase, partial [Burkholderiaceae bacterium]
PGQSYELLLRIETQGAFILPITFNKPAALLQHAVDEQMLQGVLTGLALCLIVYSLAQWVSLRDPLFAQYAMMTSGSLLFSLHFFGIGPQYLWGSSAWATEHAAGLSAFLATGGGFLFIGQALSGHDPQSRLLRSMRAGCGLCVLLGIAYGLDLLSTSAVVLIVSALGPVPSLMGIPGAVQRMRSGDSVGSTLLLAWFAYFVAVTTMICLINGLLPVNFWTLHSFQFGATLDMLLFMRVLGLRSRALHLAAIDAHRERDTLHSLAHTDPLTGLPNRRGLHVALGNSLLRCNPQHLVAVYMLDLDGFKPVNDQYGHDVGDELLIAVTRRLLGHVRESDVVSRLGGDEFVVMTPHLSQPEQAHDLGMKLLDAFRSPFALGDLQVHVGLTIGYAIAPHDSGDAIGLLKLADAAMYSGKQAGKFCLRRNTGDLALSSS